MEDTRRLPVLRRVLLAKVVITVAAWALPALLAPSSLMPLFGLATAEDPLFLRLFGALATALAVAYWYAYRDPARNAAIIRVGIVDNALATLVVVAVGLTSGTSWFVWLSALLTATFGVLLIILRPRL